MRRADVRILAATNRNLEEMIHEGKFREDLYYRLNVFPIRLRRAARAARRHSSARRAFPQVQDRSLADLSADALEYMKSYEFPGNIRELQNLIERACILAGPEGKIGRQHFPLDKPRVSADPSDLLALGLGLEQIESRLIKEALDRAQGNKTKAAGLLGISRRALYSRMESHGIPIGGPEPEGTRGSRDALAGLASGALDGSHPEPWTALTVGLRPRAHTDSYIPGTARSKIRRTRPHRRPDPEYRRPLSPLPQRASPRRPKTWVASVTWHDRCLMQPLMHSPAGNNL